MTKQELSYRKQIARQLQTQLYVDSIYDNPVTLKSRLRVTRGWKRNHWIDHTRLTISQVIIVVGLDQFYLYSTSTL